MEDNLSLGIKAYKSGDKVASRKYLIQAVQQDKDNEKAWQWLYNVAQNDKERGDCLRQVLRINPNNSKARDFLLKLEEEPTWAASVVTPFSQPAQKTKGEKKPFPIWLVVAFVFIGLLSISLCSFLGFQAYTTYSCRSQTQKYLDALEPLNIEFNDTIKVADSTPRITLGAVVQVMQRIKREMANLTAPDCAKSASQVFIRGIDGVIDGYLAFASSSEDTTIYTKITQGYLDIRNSLGQLRAIAQGLPTPTPAKLPTPTATATTKPVPTPLPQGSSAQYQDTEGNLWNVTVLEAKTAKVLYSSIGAERRAKGKYIVLKLKVINKNGYPNAFSGIGLFSLIGDDGTPYEIDLMASLHMRPKATDDSCLTLDSNQSGICYAVFDVAESETGNLFVLIPNLSVDPYGQSVAVPLTSGSSTTKENQGKVTLPEGSSITLMDSKQNTWELTITRAETHRRIVKDFNHQSFIEAQGRFLTLVVRVTNKNRTQEAFDETVLLRVIDDQNREYEPDMQAKDLLERLTAKSPGCEKMNPDFTTTCFAVFDISLEGSVYMLAPNKNANQNQPKLLFTVSPLSEP